MDKQLILRNMRAERECLMMLGHCAQYLNNRFSRKARNMKGNKKFVTIKSQNLRLEPFIHVRCRKIRVRAFSPISNEMGQSIVTRLQMGHQVHGPKLSDPDWSTYYLLNVYPKLRRNLMAAACILLIHFNLTRKAGERP